MTKVMTAPFLWKRGSTAAVDTYVAAPNEPVLDMRNDTQVLRIGDGITPGGRAVDAHGEIIIATPSILTPVDGAVNVFYTPVITSASFQGLLGDGQTADTHKASYWRISTVNDFASIAYASGRDLANLTVLDLEVVGFTLNPETDYYIDVQYEGASGTLSAISPVTHITTRTVELIGLELTKLHASDPATGDNFGISVALSSDGSIALIGATQRNYNGLSSSGSVYVFTQVDGVWTEQQKLHASDAAVEDRFGQTVALSSDGSLALIGARYDDDNGLSRSGSVYVFTQSGGVWTEQQKLHASDAVAGDNFGISVALSADGSLALIGALYDDDNGLTNSGSVYVFTRSGTTWTEQQKLHASDAAAGDDFGISVALSADSGLALIGALDDDDNDLSSSGSVYVFTRSGTTWTEQQKLHASDPAVYDNFGRSCVLSSDGSLALIGAYNDDDNGLTSSGSVYVFTRVGSVWAEQQKLHASDAAAIDNFGISVALSADGGLALIGAQVDDDNGLSGSGSVYVLT